MAVQDAIRGARRDQGVLKNVDRPLYEMLAARDYYITSPGRVRDSNEEAIRVSDDKNLNILS